MIDLVSWALIDCKGSDAGDKFTKLRSWVNDGRSVYSPVREERRVVRPPQDEVLAVLKASTPVAQAKDPKVAAFLGRRGFRPSVTPAAILPPSNWGGWSKLTWSGNDRDRTTWWPRRWADLWPLVVPAYNGIGKLVSLHGRAVDDSAPRKTTWPKGVDSGGLLFAERRYARKLLKKIPCEADKLLIVEGLTDYLWSVQSAPDGCAVMGIASGSISALRLTKFPKDLKVYIGADPDEAGDRYAQKIASTLLQFPCRRIPLHSLTAAPNGH